MKASITNFTEAIDYGLGRVDGHGRHASMPKFMSLNREGVERPRVDGERPRFCHFLKYPGDEKGDKRLQTPADIPLPGPGGNYGIL